jgi:hypothetical protein
MPASSIPTARDETPFENTSQPSPTVRLRSHPATVFVVIRRLESRLVLGNHLIPPLSALSSLGCQHIRALTARRRALPEKEEARE